MRSGFKTLEARNERYEGIIDKREKKIKEITRALRAKITATDNRKKRVNNKRGWTKEEKEEALKDIEESFNDFKKLKEEQITKAENDIKYYHEAKNEPLLTFEKKCEICKKTFKGKNALELYEDHCKTRLHKLRVGEIVEFWDCRYCKKKVRKEHDIRELDMNIDIHESMCPEKDKPRLDENGNEIIEHLENNRLEPFQFPLDWDETFEIFKKLNIRLSPEYFLTDDRLHNRLPIGSVYNHPKYGDYPVKGSCLFVSENWDMIINELGEPVCDIEHRNKGTYLHYYKLDAEEEQDPVGYFEDILGVCA
jgi:hypothetical protein